MAKEKKVKETKPLNPDSLGAVFSKGLIKENPIFISLLGLCPALAVTTSFEGLSEWHS